MKILFNILILTFFLSVISCEKVDIPKPEDPPVTELSSPFYISGNFNGTQLTKVIDGDEFIVVTHAGEAHNFLVAPQEDIAAYMFELYNTEVSETFPEIIFNLYNHDYGDSITYDDLIESTSLNFLPFLNFFEPNMEFLNHLIVDYFQEDGQYFSSFYPSSNAPLTITESKDTTLVNKPYRILGLAGDISLNEVSSGQLFLISNFKARIIFSL